MESFSSEDRLTYGELIMKAKKNNEIFNSLIEKFVVPVKFSFLALVSARKDTIFGDYLISLMVHVASRTFDGINICIDKNSFGQDEINIDGSYNIADIGL